MKPLVLTTQRLDELSGINTYLHELRHNAELIGCEIRVLSVRDISRAELWREIGRASWVHLNTSDPVSFLFAKLRGKRVLMRFHYTLWGTTLIEPFSEWGFRRRLGAEIVGRWRQFGRNGVKGLLEFGSHMMRLSARVVIGLGSDRVVGVSQFLSRALELPRNVFTVYLPFSPQFSTEIQSQSEERYLFFCARIDNVKGLFELLDSVGHLHEKGCCIKLLIAGDGPARLRAESRAQELGVSHMLQWLGRIPSAEVPRIMSRAIAVVVPSISNDPSPFTVLEAGACGIPVIGSGRGGIPEEIGEGGWIVDPMDAARFAETLWQVWNDPAECRRRGQLLRLHVKENFDAARSVRALLALMESPENAAKYGAMRHHGRW
jgi:glycosyltransferase involved in cell wall biosynthesis